MNRHKCFEVLQELTQEQLDAIAIFIETADAQGDYCYRDEVGSTWEDSVSATLSYLANEVKTAKTKG